MFLTVTVQVLQLFQTWKNEVTSWLLVGMFNEHSNVCNCPTSDWSLGGVVAGSATAYLP